VNLLAGDGEGRTQPEEIGGAAANRGALRSACVRGEEPRSERGEGGSVGMDPNLTRPAGPVGSGPNILVSFFLQDTRKNSFKRK
jgi:hypothetical protein